MSAPLVDGVLAGTIDNVRDILAVVASATIDPSQAWDRTAHGVHILLTQIDTALDEAFRPTSGCSDEADPSPDPECQPLTLALLPADYARLATVAHAWGVQPETLALTLVLDGLADIGRERQEAAA